MKLKKVLLPIISRSLINTFSFYLFRCATFSVIGLAIILSGCKSSSSTGKSSNGIITSPTKKLEKERP